MAEQAWADAAAWVGERLGVPIGAVVIGPSREVTDPHFGWARAREVEEDGAVLVRPRRARRLADALTGIRNRATGGIA